MALIVLLFAVLVVGSVGFLVWSLVEDRLPRPWNDLYRDDLIHTENDTLYDPNYGHPIDVVAEIRHHLAQIPRDPSLRWETFIEKKVEKDWTQAVLVVRLINIRDPTADVLGTTEVNLTLVPQRPGKDSRQRWDTHYRGTPPMSRRDATRDVMHLLVEPTISWARILVDNQSPPPTLDNDYRII